MEVVDRTFLINLLKGFKQDIAYLPNPGNAGDSLIACSTLQFFEKNEINYRVCLSEKHIKSTDVLVYGGGGNFGGANSRVGYYIEKYSKRVRAFILLPHTLFGAEQLLESLPSNVHLFCREKISFDHASKHCNSASVYLADDMVFDADIRALLSNTTSNSVLLGTVSEIKRRLQNKNEDFGLSLSCLLNYQMWKVKRAIKPQNYTKVLNAFREDVEKTDIELPNDNLDISALFELSSCEPELAKLSTSRFLSFIEQFDEVNTNRLHVGIAAAKLGKKVNLYGNNYFKIRAIYDFSIKGKFNNVSWTQ